jgi:hypothetical protein
MTGRNITEATNIPPSGICPFKTVVLTAGKVVPALN